MLHLRILWKNSINLTDDDTKILGVVLNYLNINLENAINFNKDFHNSQNMLDWQQTRKTKVLSVDTHIEEVGPQSSKKLDNKVPKKYIFGAFENFIKATDCLCALKNLGQDI